MLITEGCLILVMFDELFIFCLFVGFFFFSFYLLLFFSHIPLHIGFMLYLSTDKSKYFSNNGFHFYLLWWPQSDKRKLSKNLENEKETINICSKENVKNMQHISVGNNKTKKFTKDIFFFHYLIRKNSV